MSPITTSTLGDLQPGESGVLEPPRAPSREVLRLMEMGLVPGARVEICRRAPLGDPLEVIVGSTRLCVRREDARALPVRRS